MTKGCVIIGDIKRSRDIEEWAPIFKRIREVLAEISTKYREDIVVDFSPTVGDEFQGVLKSPRNAYRVCQEISLRIDVDFYCGIGIGEIERPFGVVGMRGTAFYRAREALNICKKKKRWLYILSGEKEWVTDKMLNVLFGVVKATMDSWTRRQRMVVNYVREHPRMTLEDVGRHFSVSKQNISKLLKKARWEMLKEVEEAIGLLLSQPNSDDN